MDKKTRKALEESIEHWYRLSVCMTMETVENEGYGASSCPLCQLFRYQGPLDVCKGCPVAERAGDTHCVGTPYMPAWESLDAFCEGKKWTQADQRNIEREIRFLESLLED